MKTMQDHGRWLQLVDLESDFLWNLVESELTFRPYLIPKIKSADLILDVKRIFDDHLNYSVAMNFIH